MKPQQEFYHTMTKLQSLKIDKLMRKFERRVGIDKTGFIYVMRCNKYYKIGKTTNVKNRLSAIQNANPYEVNLEDRLGRSSTKHIYLQFFAQNYS